MIIIKMAIANFVALITVTGSALLGVIAVFSVYV
tara:strand:- start:7 stop:108 length:102 start_codon:yes stop_codon:yes gene_type:complete